MSTNDTRTPKRDPRTISIGSKAAIAMSESGWWKDKDAREIVAFQLFTAELSMPFGEFHAAVEKALDRPVWTHEFGLSLSRLMDEFLGKTRPPTFTEILEMIPAEKRIIVDFRGNDE